MVEISTKATLKTNLQCSLIIALCFLWTSSGYLYWMYHLLDYLEPSKVDLLTEVIGYLFQALGILLFALAIKYKQKTILNKSAFILFIGLDFIFIILSSLIENLTLILISGYLMNILHGVIAAYYLTLLSLQVKPEHQGLAFGFGYGISSIVSWLISLINNSQIINYKYALIIYGIAICMTIALIIIEKEPDISAVNKHIYRIIPKQVLILSLSVVILISMTRGIGFFFPLSDVSNGISLEFSRAFYAFGLIIAGYISDQNRKFGSLLCLSALFFPFATIALSRVSGLENILWIMGYFFFGFLAVFRVVLFSDSSVIYLAAFGLMAGRIGDAAGNLVGIFLSDNTVGLVTVSSTLFVASFIVFFLLYNRMYIPQVKKVLNKEERLNSFAEKYELSLRETEVLKLIEEGASNGEISSKLFISENTVKFHVRNILKKTDCANRVELISMLNHQ
ncbi:MAG: LuxR family transcriptional regulator [Solobacterium sp.]|nr:LuxR family transcriptional regulator [Solobacterium sp.]MDD6121745.1 LuxR family transcriptional regulator [Solobacterium sp.]MDD6497852.1 LuxR family transcriptional regulator [Solobacterium sp.]MDD6835000.1 LuxR family transcriptional regulator [Solobacterium sp.]MDD6885176.1 LuxR family transcriptional regulator [Solobacterium sp.]